MILYKLTNSVNGKVYIGITTRTLHNRWIRHKSSANTGSQCPIHRAIRKYGVDKFIVEVLSTFTNIQELKEAEIRYISIYESNDSTKGYNLTRGGDGTMGRTHSKETRDRIKLGVRKAIQDGRMFTDQWYKNMRADRKTRRGVPLSATHKANISKSMKGKSKNYICGNPVSVDQFTKTGTFIQTFASYSEAAKHTGGDRSDIMRCCQGKRKSVKGYVFKYHQPRDV